MKYTFILLVHVILEKVLKKKKATGLFGRYWYSLSFLVALHGCQVRQKRAQRLGIGFKTELSAPSQENKLGGWVLCAALVGSRLYANI